MKNIRKTAVASLIMLVSVLGISSPALALSAPAPFVASTQSVSQACSAVGVISKSNDCNTKSGNAKNTQSKLSSTITKIVDIISAIAGIIVVIMIVISGISFMTSGGDPQGVASARNMLIYAIVGIIIVVLAQAIVHFVLNKL